MSALAIRLHVPDAIDLAVTPAGLTVEPSDCRTPPVLLDFLLGVGWLRRGDPSTRQTPCSIAI
jgi:hypothetical protein